MPQQPLILDIKGNSLDDGPGIRSVVFFKGCPLSCVWCHNPESRRAAAEISHDGRECIGCFVCTKACAENAISPTNPHFIDRGRCTLCFRCIDACPTGALSRVGTALSIESILEKVRVDIPFYATSGGGVTLSGGEPTISLPFLSKLLQALKSEKIHTLVETCGFFNLEQFVKLAYQHIDCIYFDIKLFNEESHIQYCGVSNRVILKNFTELYSLYRGGGVEVLPRIPLVPDISATEENIRSIADFLASQGVRTAQVLPYNPLWPEKEAKIGIQSPQRPHAMNTWMPAGDIRRCQEILHDEGIDCI